MYKDPRMGTEDMPQDTIITCKHFLDAVENELYGWRWVCPMGGKECRYRHMLPEGFVVVSKKDQSAQKIAADKAAACTKTLEEKIEEDRAALKFEDAKTPVTAESFAAWKVRRAQKKQDELEAKMKEEEAKAQSKGKGKSKAMQILSGRALFTFNPKLFEAEDDDENAVDLKKIPEEEEKKESEIKADADLFAAEAEGAGALDEEEPDFD